MGVNINGFIGSTVISWLGHSPFTGVQGAWFQRCWIDGTYEGNAPLSTDSSGDLTINGAKLVVESTSGSFSKTVTIDPAGYNNPIRVLNSAGSEVVVDAEFVSVGNGSETSYFYVNQIQLNDPFGEITINGSKVLTTRQSDPGNTTDTTDVATRFNNLLASLRSHGLI
jgi:hypothetical protein